MSKQWPLLQSFRIRLRMESDWHVGSGMGRPGNIDRLIVRDSDGLPFVPAKTLRGILRDAMTFVKPGVKIDRRSGHAQTDFLRFEEMARVGTVLEAECRLTVSEELCELASALLIASARLVERLGGKRRRGPGRCRLEI